jgi:hypothetical protein
VVAMVLQASGLGTAWYGNSQAESDFSLFLFLTVGIPITLCFALQLDGMLLV